MVLARGKHTGMIERKHFLLFCGRCLRGLRVPFCALLARYRSTRSKPSFIQWLREEQDWWEMGARIADEEAATLLVSHHQHRRFTPIHICSKDVFGENRIILFKRKQSYNISKQFQSFNLSNLGEKRTRCCKRGGPLVLASAYPSISSSHTFSITGNM